MLQDKDVELVREDDRLPGLAELLDNDLLLAALLPLPQFSGLRSLTTDYLRYKPGTSCVACVILQFQNGRQQYLFAKALTEERFTVSWHHPKRQALVAKQNPHAPVALHHLRIILSYPQKDRALPHLWLLNDSPDRDALFRRWLPELPATARIDLDIMRYKPERRLLALLKCDGEPYAILRFASAGRFDAMLAGNRLGHDAGEITLLAVLPDYRLLITKWIAGETLCPEQGGTLPEYDVFMMGSRLAQVHNRHLSPRSGIAPQSEIEDAWRVLNTLRAISPQQASLFQTLLTALAERMPARPFHSALIHGDFSIDQLVRRRSDGQLQLIDWDRAKSGNPAGDLASFQARLELQVIEQTLTSQQAASAIAALHAGYRHQCRVYPKYLNDYAALAMLLLATEPFRKRAADWPQQIAALLQRAQQLMLSAALQELLDVTEMAEPLRQALGLPLSAELLEASLVTSKPGRRAVLEYRWCTASKAFAVNVVGKYRCKSFDAHGYRVQQALWRGGFQKTAEVAVPEPLAALPKRHLWLQRKVAGSRMTDLLAPASVGLQRLGHLTGKALANIQRNPAAQAAAGDRCWGIEDELKMLRQRLSNAMIARPQWAERIEQVASGCEWLARSLSAKPALFLHRDFYPAQILIPENRPEQIVILDFDLSCSGPAALDAGNYIAHLHEQALRDWDDDKALAVHERAFLAAWLAEHDTEDAASVEIFTTLALARHIAISLLFPDRQATTERLITLCEQRLLQKRECG